MHVNDVSDTENRGKDTWDRAILRQVTCLVRGRLLWKSVSNIRCLMLFTLPRVGRLITALSTCSAGRLPPRLITLCFVVDCLVSEILRCSVIWTMQHHLRGVCFGVLKSMMKSSKTFKKKKATWYVSRSHKPVIKKPEVMKTILTHSCAISAYPHSRFIWAITKRFQSKQ